MRKIFLTSLALVFSSILSVNALAQTVECTANECLRIGTFNIKTFGSPTAPANEKEEIEELANIIADKAAFDVAVLTEIDLQSDNWSKLLILLTKKGFDTKIASSSGGKNNQFIVIVFRTETVERIGQFESLKFPETYKSKTIENCGYNNLRPPLVSSFKARHGSFQFRLMGVHLKSKRQDNKVASKDQQACNDEMRKDQMNRIAKHLSANPGQNYLLVGDFNDEFHYSTFDSLKALGFASSRTQGCIPADRQTCSYHGVGGPNLIDLVLYPAQLKNFVPGSGSIFFPPDMEKHLETISDHVPVWAMFRIN